MFTKNINSNKSQWNDQINKVRVSTAIQYHKPATVKKYLFTKILLYKKKL